MFRVFGCLFSTPRGDDFAFIVLPTTALALHNLSMINFLWDGSKEEGASLCTHFLVADSAISSRVSYVCSSSPLPATWRLRLRGVGTLAKDLLGSLLPLSCSIIFRNHPAAKGRVSPCERSRSAIYKGRDNQVGLKIRRREEIKEEIPIGRSWNPNRPDNWAMYFAIGSTIGLQSWHATNAN